MKTFKQAKFSFTKEHTAVAKGIAILVMFYHHLFVIEERIHCDYIPLLKFAGHDWQTPLAYFCKICVGIYVFLSGLGLYYSTQRVPADRRVGKTWLAILKKLCSFYLNYWVIFLLFVPLGFLVTEREFDKTLFWQAFFGLSTGKYNGEWWFVQAYLILLLLFPLLAWFVRSSKPVIWLVKGILAVVLIKGWHIFETAALENQGLLIVRGMIALTWPWIPVFLVGILCAKFDVYGRVRYFLYKHRIKPKPICLLVLLVVFVVRVCITKSPVDAQLDYLLAPLFVFASTTLLMGTRLSPLFQLLGKHSMNMWLTHTFWCYYYFQPLVFWPKISVLVLVWLTVLSLLTSWIINLINEPLQKLLKSVGSRSQMKTREIQSDSAYSTV